MTHPESTDPHAAGQHSTDQHSTDQHTPDRRGLPAHAATDPYWRAAMEILDGFGDDARIWAHVSPHGIDYHAILDEGWSAGQRRILLTAAALWDGRTVPLLDILAGVSDEWWQRISDAMSILRNGLR